MARSSNESTTNGPTYDSYMQFTVEAWDPEYGTGGDFDALDASTDVVDPEFELPLNEWRPIETRATTPAGVVTFVDGVRRIDARVWVTDQGRVLPGTCATVAAGAVQCTTEKATISNVEVRRAFFTPPTPGAESIETEFGTYEHVAIKTGAPEDLYLGIHEQMTELETLIVPDVAHDELLVFDGPLRRREDEQTIGLIKTQHVQYLELDEQQVVTTLSPGERSPLFTIGTGRFAKVSWYLRLPGPRTHGWAGIVRCETPAQLEDPDGHRSLANLTAATLPRFASESHKEHRAPQNLYPIKGLEHSLRRRLGDQRLLQRALRSRARFGNNETTITNGENSWQATPRRTDY